MIKTEVDPWQILETDLVEGNDPLAIDRYLILFYNV
jgi:hypothetical protein